MAPLTAAQAYFSSSQFQPLLLSRANNSTQSLSREPGLKLGSTISIAVALLVLLFIVGAALT
jgi:type VI protein secretion system component VasK